MNIKTSKKKNQCDGIYDSLEDSYCSLIEFDEFKNNIDTYIDNAIDKRNRKEDFDIVKRMQKLLEPECGMANKYKNEIKLNEFLQHIINEKPIFRMVCIQANKKDCIYIKEKKWRLLMILNQ